MTLMIHIVQNAKQAVSSSIDKEENITMSHILYLISP